MKKILVTILALVYFTASTGATVQLHYCMGKLVDWGLADHETEQCGNCGMEKTTGQDNGCCKDEVTQISIEKDQKTVQTFYQLMQVTFSDLPVAFYEIPAFTIPALAEETPVSNAPPRNTGIALHIRNCIFLI